MGGKRAPALCDDIGLRKIVFGAGIDQSRHRVIGIFLDGIVHGALGCGITSAVIVYAQTAADVHETYVEAHFRELHIELRSLAQSVLYVAYLGNLAAYMEMNQTQALLHLVAFQEVKGLKKLAGIETELRLVAA